MSKLFDWMKNNRLLLNKYKSHYLLIGVKKDKFLINNFGIEKTPSVKILGVLLNDRLSFSEHINDMSKKMSKKIGVIERVRYLIPQKALILVYEAIIQSIITYSCQVWGFTYPTHIRKLVVQQTRVIKFLTNDNTDMNSIFKKFGLLPVNNLINFYSNIYIFKSLNCMTSHFSISFLIFKNHIELQEI